MLSRVLLSAIAAGALACVSGGSTAQVWHITPVIGAQADLSDNVGLAPAGEQQSDFVTLITPSVRLTEKGAHTSLVGSISMPVALYARTSENNDVRPEINVSGTAELVERLFFIDASAGVSQQYFSPFGARPQNLINVTNNRYTSRTYQVSPYIKGEGSEGLRYELRDSNAWTSTGSAPIATNRAYTNEIVGSLVREPRPAGWSVDYDRVDTRFSNQDPLISEIARGHLLFRPDPEWELSATGGYENNRYVVQNFSGIVYGIGARWHPSDRTTVDATWEHRFFGASYHFTFDHRTPLSVWSVSAMRDITSYPQQLASLAAGTNVGSLLSQILFTRILDPAGRQAAVDQFIRDRGLPSVLSSPFVLYSQQTTLVESVQATIGLLGARNSIFLTAFHARNEPVSSLGELATDTLLAQTNNTQTGANAVWTHQLTALYTLAASADWVRAVANDESGERTNQGTLRLSLSAPLSPLTSLFAGARYQRLTSNVQSGYREAAVFAGFTHEFR